MRELSRVILMLLLVALTACEDNKVPPSGNYHGGSIPSADQVNDYIDDQLTPEQRCQMEMDDENHPLDYPLITPKGSRKWETEWSQSVSRDLDDPALDELLSVKLKNDELRDLNCPKFNSMSEKNKKLFWNVFMASMSASESSHNPKGFYDEKGTYDSYGLLQIDATNSRTHGCVKHDGTKPAGGKYGKSGGGDMYDPETNLRCGLYILRNQLRKSGQLFYGKSYWAVLRTSRPGHQRFKKHFLSHIQQVKACRGEGEVDNGVQNDQNQCVAVNDAPRDGQAPRVDSTTNDGAGDSAGRQASMM
jgi:hypothetical protein